MFMCGNTNELEIMCS